VALRLAGGRVQLNLVKRWLDDALRVETERALEPGRWHHVAATYDGSRTAAAVRLYIDGKPEKLRVLLDDLNQTFQTNEPFRVGSGYGERFRGRLGDVRVYRDRLSDEEVEAVSVPESVAEIVAADRRTPAQERKLTACYLDRHAPNPVRAARREVVSLRREKQRLEESFPTTMVMEEMPRPRDSFVLKRGRYDQPGEPVAPGVPGCLPPLPSGPPNRLTFARWLTDPNHPLTARVAVNRHWQMLFGTGLVRTIDDFGAQGEPPTHPELLDWLATEYVRLGWDTKALLKTIVTSATYRQSSKVSRESAAKDPENRLLGRGVRLRLPAEMVRDQALFVSGLLVEKVGGPSVRPYQPPGLWKELDGGKDYVADQGEGLWRRSLYTFWKRAAPPPTMMTFDAAGREACTVREARTNTPLQALALMNDVTFVEASRRLAQRAMTEGGSTEAERIGYAFRLAAARRPTAAEAAVLVENYRRQLDSFRERPEAARKLLRVGSAPRDERFDERELAALTAVAGLILNLDEVVTKE
jgi:Protein of unknown function (DUF1553)/Concanavalin A-like lectin/glucanases superfamily